MYTFCYQIFKLQFISKNCYKISSDFGDIEQEPSKIETSILSQTIFGNSIHMVFVNVNSRLYFLGNQAFALTCYKKKILRFLSPYNSSSRMMHKSVYDCKYSRQL